MTRTPILKSTTSAAMGSRVSLHRWPGATMAPLRCAAFAMLACMSVANAQQPGSSQYNSVFLPAHGVGDTAQPPQESDRWGAMAVSSENSLSGFAVGQGSRDESERAATQTCLERGGVNCYIEFSFRNRCAAVVTGGGRTVSVDDLTLSRALKAARRRCGSGCKLLYEGCALASGGR